MLLTLLGFIVGNGLVGLGAFFLCRSFTCQRFVIAELLSVVCVMSVAMIVGQTEIVAGLVWGTVAVNLTMVGGICLWRGMGLARENWLLLVWLGLGLVTLLVAGYGSGLGVFGGCGLIFVGVMALLMAGDMGKQQTKERRRLDWLWWLKLGIWLLVTICGALVLLGHQSVMTVVGLPSARTVMFILTPMLALFVLLAQWKQQTNHRDILQGLLWVNVVLVTFGCGFLAVGGCLCFSQIVEVVILPSSLLMTLLLGVMMFMPKKTTRWWGGLIVLMYMGVLLGLLIK